MKFSGNHHLQSVVRREARTSVVLHLESDSSTAFKVYFLHLCYFIDILPTGWELLYLRRVSFSSGHFTFYIPFQDQLGCHLQFEQ